MELDLMDKVDPDEQFFVDSCCPEHGDGDSIHPDCKAKVHWHEAE